VSYGPGNTVNPICHLLAFLGAHYILHVSRIRVKARDARRIRATEMKYIRTAGYTWTDYKTNTQITKELKITAILDKLLEYKRNWIQHVNTRESQ
jgi:hypothetical protein